MSTWENLISFADGHGGGKFLFRGQGDDSAIMPKIGRQPYFYSRAREKALFAAFKRQAPPFVRIPVSSDWEWLALAQHHGAPTRLTDWSTSPLVAAWFAVSSYPMDSDAYVYALDTEGSQVTARVDPISETCSNGWDIRKGPLAPNDGYFLLETTPVSSRITTQRGLFMLHGDPKKPLVIRKPHKLMIPQTDRDEVMEKLAGFGVEASHIFPDLDGLCKSLDWRMKLKKSLGFI